MSGRRGPGRLLWALPLLFLVGTWAMPAAAAATLHLVSPVVTADQAAVHGPLTAATAFAVDLDRAGGPSSLRLAADQAHLELDRSERPLLVDAGGTGIGVLPANETTFPADLADLVLAGLASDHSARILVWPLAAGAAEVHGAAPGAVEARAVAEPASSVTAVSGTRGQHVLPGAGVALVTAGPTIEVRGDLRIAVTGLALEGTTAGHPVTIETRRDDEGLAPGAGGLSTRRTVAWEAVVELRGAVLQLPAGALLAAALDVEAPAMSFGQATGTVFGVPADGQSVAAEGRLTAHLVPAADARQLDAAVNGRVAEVHVGTTAVVVPRDAWATPWLALGLLPVALLAHVARGRLRFRHLDRAVREQRYTDALRLAGRFRLHPRLAQDALLAEALSLTELGRAADARARLLGRATWSPVRQGMRDFLLARAAARLGDVGEATRRLASSLLADPALRPQAAADPALVAIVDRRPGTAASVAQEAYA